MKPRAAKGRRQGAVSEEAARNPAGVSRPLMVQATQVLGAVLSFEHPADAVLSQHFREHREIGHRDRGFIAESVYGVLRRLRWLHRIAGAEAGPRQLLLAWLARGEGWPMRNFEGLASTTERDWVAELKARDSGEGDLSVAERADLPDWLAERLLAGSDEAALLALAHSLNRPAPLDLRVNLLKSDRDALLVRLRADGFEAAPGALSPQAIRLGGKPALQKHPAFLDGSFEVQDQGSQLLGCLVQPRRG